MSWLASIGVALLTATAGLFVSGFVASLAVGWYRVSSFEGGSGYFVAALALLGLVVGIVVGLVVSRVIAASAHAGFLRALGISLATLLLLVAVVGGTARALADVPPEIDGEQLLLAVELRWPPGRQPDRGDTAERSVTLGSVNGSRVQRASEQGPLWLEDAHQVDGRWVVPGAVRVFTARGARSLAFGLADSANPAFIVPLPARPTRAQMQWSEWMPRARPGATPLPADMFTYRFRIVRTSEPVRAQAVGPFEVLTIARGFFDARSASGPTQFGATSTFLLRHRGTPYAIAGAALPDSGAPTRSDRADGIAVIGGGDRTALLAHVAEDASEGRCFVVTDGADGPHAAPVGQCVYPFDARLVTNDPASFRDAGGHAVVRGFLDRTTFERPGLYLLGDAVLDTRTLAVRRYTPDPNVPPMPSVPPLGVSPDERSIVRFTFTESDMRGATLVVTDLVADSTYTLPIDAARTHFQKYERLDPAWVSHYFEWRRAGGVDRLVERAHATPLAYRGTLSLGDEGAYYWLEPARAGLRDAVLAFLRQEMHAELQPKGEYQLAQPVRVGDTALEVSYGEGEHYVSVSLAPDEKRTAVLEDFARRFDAALATGRYDALFGR